MFIAVAYRLRGEWPVLSTATDVEAALSELGVLECFEDETLSSKMKKTKTRK